MFLSILFIYIFFLLFSAVIYLTIFKSTFSFKYHNMNDSYNYYSFLFLSIILFIFIIIVLYSYSLLDSGLLFNCNAPFYYFYFFFIIVLITGISLIFCLSYNFSEMFSFTLYISIILLSGFGLLSTNSIIYFFSFYEFLLLPSFIILYKYAKTRKSVEAAYLMFFWTQFGAIFLIFIFIYIVYITESYVFSSLNLYKFNSVESNLIFLFLLMGFGVKLPLWPFYDWLPKAHVEASTNFSIFLSGVLVKFAFFGLFKCLNSLNLDFSTVVVYPYLLVGMVDSVFKTFYQIDIKKIIAFATVAEMHWLVICFISGNNILFLSGLLMSLSHAILSTNSFLMVDSISRRYKTRLITEMYSINLLNPKLFLFILLNCIAFLGFPGSLFFLSELLFFSYMFDLYPLFSLIIMVLVYLLLATFFWRVWMNILFSSLPYNLNRIPSDLDKRETLIFSVLLILLFILGFSFNFINL